MPGIRIQCRSQLNCCIRSTCQVGSLLAAVTTCLLTLCRAVLVPCHCYPMPLLSYATVVHCHAVPQSVLCCAVLLTSLQGS
jgi:hypothetical protein